MITYTTEEVEGWAEYMSKEDLAVHVFVKDPTHGIAAWKARNAKDEDAEWLREYARYHHDEADANRFRAIADRLEALQKERDDLYFKLCDAVSEIDKRQKRVAELEATIAAEGKPQPDADGWIPHVPEGVRPCPPNTLVTIRRKGNEYTIMARDAFWRASGEMAITHWRPAK